MTKHAIGPILDAVPEYAGGTEKKQNDVTHDNIPAEIRIENIPDRNPEHKPKNLFVPDIMKLVNLILR
jgi:hypothetical protein